MTSKEIWNALRRSGTGERKLRRLARFLDREPKELLLEAARLVYRGLLPEGTLGKIARLVGVSEAELAALAEAHFEFREVLPFLKRWLNPPAKEPTLASLSDEEALQRAEKIARDNQKFAEEAALKDAEEGAEEEPAAEPAAEPAPAARKRK